MSLKKQVAQLFGRNVKYFVLRRNGTVKKFHKTLQLLLSVLFETVKKFHKTLQLLLSVLDETVNSFIEP
jgi:hypothetical protein